MKKKSTITVNEATKRAFEVMSDLFYLNQITKVVWNICKPSKPEGTSISAQLRRLRKAGNINYHANQVGLYQKLT